VLDANFPTSPHPDIVRDTGFDLGLDSAAWREQGGGSRRRGGSLKLREVVFHRLRVPMRVLWLRRSAQLRRQPGSDVVHVRHIRWHAEQAFKDHGHRTGHGSGAVAAEGVIGR
jgi:hypothetical protein